MHGPAVFNLLQLSRPAGSGSAWLAMANPNDLIEEYFYF